MTKRVLVRLRSLPAFGLGELTTTGTYVVMSAKRYRGPGDTGTHGTDRPHDEARLLMRRIVVGLTALALFSVSWPALADTSESERLFAEGRALMLEGRFDEACPKIAESQRLEPHTGTLLNLAACHERQGKVGSAWVEYEKALIAARTEGQVDRTRLAEERIRAIEPRVPWLKIALRTPRADVVVKLDGGEVAPVALGTEMPVDPGLHLVSAARNDEELLAERIDVREGEHRTVVVDGSERQPYAAEDEQTPLRLVVEPKPAPRPAPRNRWMLQLGVYAGYAIVDSDHLKAVDESAVVLESISTSERTSCAALPCSYVPTKLGTGSAGLDVFAGYAFTDSFHAGIRLLAGPMFSGGAVWAFGPSIGFRPTSWLTFGVFAAFGDARISGRGMVYPVPDGYRDLDKSYYGPAVSTELAGGGGGGLEISLRLAELPRGEILLTATPFYLASSQGRVLMLPLGLAYRFQ